jgi:cholest-4-en-3-one 26-monooxygenase
MTTAARNESEITLENLDIASDQHFEEHGYPHAEWTYLRRHAPVFWYDRPNVEPFWAITKHADIVELSKQPTRFLNEPRIAVFTKDIPPPPERTVRHLLNMDPPDHREYRNVSSRQFTPRVVTGLREKVARVTKETLDEGARLGTCDFVMDVSAPITISVIAEMLGVPAEDRPLLFRWTNEIIAPLDPEFQRGREAEETISQARIELFAYFQNLSEERRVRPKDDIISVVVAGKVYDKELDVMELLSYYFLLVVAGNETTRNAMTGGLLAFMENPGEWERLKADAGLMDTAIEEVVRWTTPVIQFCRTGTEDYVLRGVTIPAGQSVCLFYPSANRDEDIFEDPFRFHIDRTPNDHIGFGRGEHVCLGAHLARLELRCAFEQMRERVVSMELAGKPQRVRSSFVGGIKRVPIRWQLRDA